MVVKTKHAFTYFTDDAQKENIEEKIQTKSLLFRVKNVYYAVSFDKEYVLYTQKNSFTIPEAVKISIAVLDDPAHYRDFVKDAPVEITNTNVAYVLDGDSMTTRYSFITEKGIPLVAVFPHQWDYIQGNYEVIGTFQTLRGEMKIIRSNAFSTKMLLNVPPSFFTPVDKWQEEIKVQLIKDVDKYLKAPVPESRNYFLGTWLGTGNRLLLLSETMGMDNEKKKLQEYLTKVLLESLDHYKYDTEKTSLIALKPEFGNEKLNDHHFHYGYYIQTAAIVSRMDKSVLFKVKDKINDMVKDIATTERGSDVYPFLRNFEPYEGHSWADGMAGFGDGNNQESTSESINAWYSLYLWSTVVNDERLKHYSLAMYRTEIEATKYYWFDIKDIYKSPYKHEIASLVWGGKVDFSTWFSGNPNMIYGIQLLPFTPASDYLGALPDFKKYEKDFISSGGGYNGEWANLLWIWKSYYDTLSIDQVPQSIKLEDRNPLSIVYYFIARNSKYK